MSLDLLESPSENVQFFASNILYSKVKVFLSNIIFAQYCQILDKEALE